MARVSVSRGITWSVTLSVLSKSSATVRITLDGAGDGNTGASGIPIDIFLSKAYLKHVILVRISGDATKVGIELRDIAGTANQDDHSRIFYRAPATTTRIDEVNVTMGDIPVVNTDIPTTNNLYYAVSCSGGTPGSTVVYELVLVVEGAF